MSIRYKGGQAERNEDDEEAGEEMGTHGEVREDREAVEQRVTANNRDGARGEYRLTDVTDKEGKVRETGSDGEEGWLEKRTEILRKEESDLWRHAKLLTARLRETA
jgi:hypothetical protein